MCDITAVPRVSVSSSPRSPKIARVGIVYSSRAVSPTSNMFDIDGFALAERFDHGAGIFFRHVDDDVLDRLPALAVAFGDDDLRLGDRELVAFAAHRLDEDREMQFAAAAHFERVGRVGVGDAQRDVGFEFAHEALANLARREKLAFASGKRRVVDAERHRDGRFVDRDRVNALGFVRVGNRVADVEVFDARDADDVAGRRFLDLDALQSGERQQRREAQPRDDAAVARDLGDRRVRTRRSAEDAADADAADVLVVIDRGDQHLERAFLGRRFGNVRDDRFEERLERVARVLERTHARCRPWRW